MTRWFNDEIRERLTKPRAGTARPEAGTEPPADQKPVSVSELTADLKRHIERKFGDVFVEGEVSSFRPAGSGHVYFVLKDARCTINCVLWATDAAQLKQPVRDGDTVEIRGRISLYEQRGQYQIIVSSIRPAGIGRLWQAFQLLKERLEQEGLFDPARKRPIPPFPRTVGVVTSPTGAAIRDILQILGRRAPHLRVRVYPVRVQGEGAAQEIAHAINRTPALSGAEVLIVGRGGGSLEDLWAFNEEVVARAIARCPIPVISAVGHETDVTIADFVADHRAPTPSAAAELVSKSSADTIREISHLCVRLRNALAHRVEPLRRVAHLEARLRAAVVPRIGILRSNVQRFEQCHALQRPIQRVNEYRQRLDDTVPRLRRGLDARLSGASHRARTFEAQLQALSPKGILERGYSITFDPKTGGIVRAAREASPGQPLGIVLHEGQLGVTVGKPGERRTRRTKRGGETPEWFGTLEQIKSTGEKAD
jgi:exodeoxyribonuclease VII large subunit